MNTYMIPCLLGLEKLVGDEVRRLGLQDVQVENGHVLCRGTDDDCARLNINLRCGARVLLVLSQFPARTFEELFQGVRAIAWEDCLPRDASFPVKGYSISSQLFSVPSCQSIIKKAIVERLKTRYRLEQFPESGVKYQIRFSIQKDQVSICLDTSGEGLYKRGYRAVGVEAPLRETLAAALVILSRYRGRDPFCDPFCGSGTIPIEAALIAKNRAPGLRRTFDAVQWGFLGDTCWRRAREEAQDREFLGSYDIWGGDIDPNAVAIARDNARKAGVEDAVRFETADVRRFRRESEYGQLVTNPPYGERLMEKAEAEELYRALGKVWRDLPAGWRTLILSSHTEFERSFGRSADKKRKLYNGMIKCDVFMYGKRV
ncbi:MAG: class I SAM-dependent RNA methyltransferase [Oscillospiraceae bacterium]|nr:class I SAM-dependent RNA methyltransferase [Oscillospiraceae bacterium]